MYRPLLQNLLLGALPFHSMLDDFKEQVLVIRMAFCALLPCTTILTYG